LAGESNLHEVTNLDTRFRMEHDDFSEIEAAQRKPRLSLGVRCRRATVVSGSVGADKQEKTVGDRRARVVEDGGGLDPIRP